MIPGSGQGTQVAETAAISRVGPAAGEPGDHA